MWALNKKKKKKKQLSCRCCCGVLVALLYRPCPLANRWQWAERDLLVTGRPKFRINYARRLAILLLNFLDANHGQRDQQQKEKEIRKELAPFVSFALKSGVDCEQWIINDDSGWFNWLPEILLDRRRKLTFGQSNQFNVNILVLHNSWTVGALEWQSHG